MSPSPMATADRADEEYIARALALAERARGLTSPNPLVGAIVVKSGVVVGEGYHRQAGAAHAEVEAMTVAGEQAREATLYVTLEPCVHHGRTPPCVPLVIEAGIRRVVVAVKDPNPLVNGRGIDALRQAGCEVSVGSMADAALDQNRAFFVYMAERRPLVTLKAAMTLDGKIAAWDRNSRWITGEPARLLVHRMRSESDAIAVGIGTVLQDDPELTVRLPSPWPREPYRIVVDSHCRIPLDARVLRAGHPERTLVAITEGAPLEKVRALEALGVALLRFPSRDGRVDLSALLFRLGALEVTALLLEGGSELNAAFLESGLVDRVKLFVAPLFLGGRDSPGPVGGPGRSLKEAFRLRGVTVRRVGEDFLIEGDLQRGA